MTKTSLIGFNGLVPKWESYKLSLVNYYRVLRFALFSQEIDGIDVIGLINKHYQILKVAESKKSTENFERYYKNFNNHIIK